LRRQGGGTRWRKVETTRRMDEMRRGRAGNVRRWMDEMSKRQRGMTMRKPTTATGNQRGPIKSNCGESKPTTANRNQLGQARRSDHEEDLTRTWGAQPHVRQDGGGPTRVT